MQNGERHRGARDSGVQRPRQRKRQFISACGPAENRIRRRRRRRLNVAAGVARARAINLPDKTGGNLQGWSQVLRTQTPFRFGQLRAANGRRNRKQQCSNEGVVCRSQSHFHIMRSGGGRIVRRGGEARRITRDNLKVIRVGLSGESAGDIVGRLQGEVEFLQIGGGQIVLGRRRDEFGEEGDLDSGALASHIVGASD